MHPHVPAAVSRKAPALQLGFTPGALPGSSRRKASQVGRVARKFWMLFAPQLLQLLWVVPSSAHCCQLHAAALCALTANVGCHLPWQEDEVLRLVRLPKKTTGNKEGGKGGGPAGSHVCLLHQCCTSSIQFTVRVFSYATRTELYTRSRGLSPHINVQKSKIKSSPLLS